MLLAVTIGMGVLIVAGVVVVAVVVVQRLGGGTPAATLLHEPPGTRIVGESVAGDRLAVQLSGGGPDRIVLIETRSGRVLATVALAP